MLRFSTDCDDEMIERQVPLQDVAEESGDRCFDIPGSQRQGSPLKIYEEKDTDWSDIEMPGINGIEAAQQIRQADKDCCIISRQHLDEFSYAKRPHYGKGPDYLLCLRRAGADAGGGGGHAIAGDITAEREGMRMKNENPVTGVGTQKIRGRRTCPPV